MGISVDGSLAPGHADRLLLHRARNITSTPSNIPYFIGILTTHGTRPSLPSLICPEVFHGSREERNIWNLARISGNHGVSRLIGSRGCIPIEVFVECF